LGIQPADPCCRPFNGVCPRGQPALETRPASHEPLTCGRQVSSNDDSWPPATKTSAPHVGLATYEQHYTSMYEHSFGLIGHRPYLSTSRLPSRYLSYLTPPYQAATGQTGAHVQTPPIPFALHGCSGTLRCSNPNVPTEPPLPANAQPPPHTQHLGIRCPLCPAVLPSHPLPVAAANLGATAVRSATALSGGVPRHTPTHLCDSSADGQGHLVILGLGPIGCVACISCDAVVCLENSWA
jgi:hypothetical protein